MSEKITVVIGASIAKLKRNFNKAVNVVKTASQKMKKAFANASKKMGRSGKVAIAGLVVGLGLLAKKAIDVASSFEQTALSFKVMMGSAKEATKLLADLTEFSTKTPFEPKQLYKAGKQLLAFGFSVENIIPSLKKIGDISAGTGKDFNELTLILGKAFAKGKVDSEALNQMSEAGIPIVKTLGKMYGVTGEEVYKMASKGKIGFADINQAFTTMTGEGGLFNNMMAQQSNTLNGLTSTLKGNISEIGKGIANSWIPAIKEAIKYANELASVFSAIEKAKSDAKKDGTLTIEQATKQVEAEIDKDYKNNPNFRKKYEQTVQGYKNGMGVKGYAKQTWNKSAHLLTGGLTGSWNQDSARDLAFKREKAIRLAKMGFTNGATVVTRGISASEVKKANVDKVTKKTTPKKTYLDSVKENTIKNLGKLTSEQTAKINSAKDVQEVLLIQKAITAEKVAQVKLDAKNKQVADKITNLKNQFKYNQLILAGKEKEAKIQKALDEQAKTKGKALTDKERTDTTNAVTALYNQNEANRAKFVNPVQQTAFKGDSAIRMGAVLGGQARTENVTERILKTQEKSLKNLENQVNQIELKIPSKIENTNNGVFP